MTQQDLQGIADSLIPGSTVRDPGAFARFLEEKEEQYRAMTGEPPENSFASLFNRTLGRGIGAVGRGALGVGRFVGEGFAPQLRSAEPILSDPNIVQPSLQALDAYSKTSGGIAAENLAPLASGTSYGLDPNAFDAFVENLRREREAQGIIDALTLQANRDAFRQTEFASGVAPALEIAGDVTNLIPLAPVARSLGLAGRAAPRVAGEAAQTVATTGARPVVTAAQRGETVAAQSATREATRPVVPFGPNRTTEGVPGGIPAGAADEAPTPPASPVDELEAEVAAVRERLRANGIPPRQRLTPEQELEAEVAARRSGTRPPGAASSAQPAGPRRVIDLIRVSKRLRPTVEEAIREQRRAGAEAGREAAARQTTALGRTRAFIGGQAGRRTSQNRFEPVAEAVPGSETLEGFPDLTPTQASKALGVTGDDFETMFRQVESSISDTFEVADAQRGLIRLLLGQTATPRQAKFLERVFGREMAEAARARTPLSALRKAGDIAYDVGFLLTKAFRSAVDASAMLRQAVIYTLNPRPSRVKITAESLGQMIRVGFARPGEAEKTAREVFTKITDPAANKWARQLYQTGSEKSRLYLQNPDKPLFDFTKREEAFASSIAETLPSLGKEFRTIRGRPVPQPVQTAVRAATLPIRAAGSVVRRSELMFGTYLNEVRNSIATHTLDNWSRAGRPITQAEVEELRRGINIFTGRGELGPLENSAKFLSAIFWSPRLWAARLEAPFFPLRGVLDPSVRRASAELAKDLVAFTTTGLTMLYLIDKTGLAQVESDPRSPNFGKIKVGNRTFDFWGGFQQQARYVTQLLTGERKTLTGDKAGEIEEVLPKDVAFNLIRSKLSPGVPTLIGNEFAGSTFDREPIRRLSQERQRMVARGQADSPNEIRLKTAAEQMVPLFLFDLGKAVEEEGAAGGLLQVPESLGVGVQTINEDKEGQR